MGQVFRLSVRQLAGGKRSILVALLAAVPVSLSAIIGPADDRVSASDFVRFLLDGIVVATALPIATMVLATATFGNELEDRTLGYLVLKPISRWWIVLPKFLAAIAVAGPLLVISGVVATVLGLESPLRPALAVAVSLLAGVTAYSAIFTWAGLVTTRALGFALVYVFLWEGLLTSFLGNVSYLSVRGYTLSLMYGLDSDGLGALRQRAIELPAAVAGVVAVTIVFVWLTERRLRRMDVP